MTTVFCAVANSRESASGRGRIDMRVGIIGVGMTAFRPSTPEYSWKELMFEAASRAYADAGVDPRTEVDSFVTCAEDYYEGFGIFDEFTPDQIGGALRPVCTVTGDGLQGLANAFMQIQTGLIDIAVVEAHSKASDILTLEGIIEHGLDPIWNKPLGGHPFLIAGLEADAFLRKTRTSAKALAAVVAKNRKNALRNPLAAYAANVDAAQVLSSPERFTPLRALDIAAPADGGVVLVLASEAAAKRRHANPVWIRGIGWASDSPTLETRDWTQAAYAQLAAEMAYRLAKVRRPATEIDFAEVDDRFSYKERQHLEAVGLAKKGEAGRTVVKGGYDPGGAVPVNGTAPAAFDGVHMKGEYLLDGCGGYRKPYTRVFTGGGTGVFSSIAGWWHVASGLADAVLVVNEEKMSSCQPHPQSVFAHIWDPILDRPLRPNLIWIFAMEMNRYMHVHGVKKEDIARVAVKNKRNAVGHPCAQLADPNITVDDVLASEVMAWPVQRLDISPPSDGASAVVLASEDFIRRRKIKDHAWISGVGWCIDSTMWTDRDLYFPEYVARAAKQAYKMAKISDPRKQIDFAEPYDPFDYKELHHLEGLLLAKKGEAPILTREGVTERDGELPVCPSGGLMGVGNPIAATMGQKIGELFWQLTNQAGKRQIPHEVRTGVAQAWGDLMQYGSVVVMSS